MKQLFFLCAILILFVSCGSSSKETKETNNNALKYAYFVDSAVEGISYTCNEISGLTLESGKFYYKGECKIEFKIGDLILGEINSQSINKDKYVLPADILGVNRKDTKHKKVLELIQLLQSLDEDNEPNNNITIKESTRLAFKKGIMHIKNNTIHDKKIASIISSLNKNVTSENKALVHYENTLKENLNVEINKEYKFNYENQKDVNIKITSDGELSNKQVLLYQNQKIFYLSVGEHKKFTNKIMSSVFNKNGELDIKLTLANHIKHIWIVIPYYQIKKKLYISNSINLNINKHGEFL